MNRKNIELLPNLGGTITPQDMAEALGVHRATIYRHIDTGDITAKRLFGRWRIPLEELERWTMMPEHQIIETIKE